MMEKGRTFYLDPDGKGAELYAVERSEDGRFMLVPCGPEETGVYEVRTVPGTPCGPEETGMYEVRTMSDTPAAPGEAGMYEVLTVPGTPAAPDAAGQPELSTPDAAQIAAVQSVPARNAAVQNVPAQSAAARNVPVRNTATLGEFARKWLDSVKWQVKESSYIKYWNLLNQYIVPELGDLQWHTLNRETVELFCSRMLSAGGRKRCGLSSRTVSDIMAVLRRVFRYAADCGAAAPFNISSIIVKREPKEMRILTRKEMRKLYRYLCGNLNDRNMGILICMFTGLRLGEICALKWEDISFSEHTVHVHRTMQRIQTKDDPGRRTKIIITPPKSRSSVRRIPMPEELARLLSGYRGSRTGYVLTGKEEAYVEPRTMERHFEKVLEKAGIGKVNFHALRHTFATQCVEMEFDVKSLSEILGHSNVNITLNRYVHPPMELKRRNMQKLSALMAVGW